MKIKRAIAFAKSVIADFSAHDVMSLAAAVAFYTALSFAPLVLLLVNLGGLLGEGTQGRLIRVFEQELGPRAADVTRSVVETAQQQSHPNAWWRWALGTGLLIVSASGVFAQLQASLNRIWNVEADPTQGLWGWLRKRLISMGMVFAVLFVLLVSLVISTLIEAALPASEAIASQTVVLVASLVVTTLLFAAMFKFLPDATIAWSSVWMGAAFTSLLFNAGKLILSLYLDRAHVGESYGQAAGGLIALLVWVYYSCIILFIGAEITQRLAQRQGVPARPAPHAHKTARKRPAITE